MKNKYSFKLQDALKLEEKTGINLLTGSKQQIILQQEMNDQLEETNMLRDTTYKSILDDNNEIRSDKKATGLAIKYVKLIRQTNADILDYQNMMIYENKKYLLKIIDYFIIEKQEEYTNADINEFNDALKEALPSMIGVPKKKIEDAGKK